VTRQGVPILGWDVGGANIKVSRPEPDDGISRAVLEHPFPLWREYRRLPSVLSALAGRAGRAQALAVDAGQAPAMAVTMTAELADCFATKREGVGFVIGAFQAAFPASATWFYGTDGRFHSAEEAQERPLDVAAANWMASATLVARTHPDALLVDVGSTTTDIVPIVAGRVSAGGYTDLARLRLGELVYTGCLRTPVCAILRSVPLAAGRCRVAAEHFAVTADVYRWLGQITEEEYTCDTPDGRGRSRSEAGARLARVVCADLETLGAADLTAIADHIARAQTRQILYSIREVMRRLRTARPHMAVLAGSGAFLARAAAEAAGLATSDLVSDLGADAARAAPAAAVAQLLAEVLGR
jgi:probable H4MPT-linked C1 transfer pathway protein